MQRWLPHGFISILVGLTWIMMAHSLDASDILTAVILGIVIPKIVAPFIANTPDIKWQGTIKLFFTVLWDIVISNFLVAKLVLGPKENLDPKWFRVPLETNHEQVNALLAMIITTTPGTVSAGIDQERGDILVHALSSSNTANDIAVIKHRYEKPLIQIFNVQTGEKK